MPFSKADTRRVWHTISFSPRHSYCTHMTHRKRCSVLTRRKASSKNSDNGIWSSFVSDFMSTAVVFRNISSYFLAFIYVVASFPCTFSFSLKLTRHQIGCDMLLHFCVLCSLCLRKSWRLIQSLRKIRRTIHPSTWRTVSFSRVTMIASALPYDSIYIICVFIPKFSKYGNAPHCSQK